MMKKAKIDNTVSSTTSIDLSSLSDREILMLIAEQVNEARTILSSFKHDLLNSNDNNNNNSK